MDLKELRAGKTIENKGHHPWEFARFEVVHSLLKKHSKLNGLNIIDIGCGDTFFLETLSSRLKNCNYYGVDTAFDNELISFLKKRLSDKNIKLSKNISKLEKDNTKADIVFLLDVIEHLEDDLGFLTTIKDSATFTNNTLLFITVPAFNLLYISRDKWLGHYRRYTLKGLKNILTKSNLRVMHSGYFFTNLFIARFINSLIEKIIKPDLNKITGIGNWKERKLIDTFIKNSLVIDFRIFSIFKYFGFNIPGLSCFAICKKQLL